jgi:DUF4097 and DUF4098 domain-containing protein YvlB
MKPRAIATFVCLALGCVSVAAARELTEHATSQQTLRFPKAAGRTLDVRTIEGTISVEAYDGSDVELLVNKSISADSQDDLRAAEREVTLDTSDDAATMRAIVRYPDQPTCGEKSEHRHWVDSGYDVRFDFTIRVPRETRLELCSINEGNIVMRGTRGDFLIRTVNGRITMADVAGSGEATTVNGPVTASFVVAPRSQSLFRTINGDVIVTVPDGLAADLRMKTFNGGLYTDFDVQTLPSTTLVKAERRDGMSVYRSSGFTTVRAGGGGPVLTLDTLNGDVRVLKSAK